MKQEYIEAFAEVSEVIKLMPKALVNKIPDKFLEMIEREKDKEYITNIHEPIEECKLKDETIIILGLIYRDFLCAPEERKRLQEKDAKELQEFKKNLEIELREKYNPDNVFKKNKEVVEENNENTQMIEYKEQSFLKRLFDKIKQLFSRK